KASSSAFVGASTLAASGPVSSGLVIARDHTNEVAGRCYHGDDKPRQDGYKRLHGTIGMN
ncbi:MAG: hypothetical protein ACREKE_00990, partial [bacterium]